ncbi:condensation domain-containing protein, partial [Goodfellowiella coeruleoviolacea]
EFVGRVDDQVKIRGFRVEPGEVEAVLASHPAIAQAAVTAQESRTGQRLLAYLVTEAGHAAPDTADIREHAARLLPEALVPSAFLVLDRLPLTANGKLDRSALPAPDRTLPRPGRSPRTPREKVLCALFADVLGIPEVGVDDGFFALGGHSLLAMRLVARIRRTLHTEVSVRTVFEAPTVAGLAARIDGPGPARPPIVPVERPELIPLSFAQQRLWFLDQLRPGSTEYQVPVALRLFGPLDRAALAEALTAVVARHEALRTTFQVADGTASQVIHPPTEVPLPVLDLRGRGAELDEVLRAEISCPHDLTHGPLLRALLIHLADADHVLLLQLHHIITDGWSMGVLLGDLATGYRAARDGEPVVLPPPPVQYADYAVWQRRVFGGSGSDGVLAGQLDHW